MYSKHLQALKFKKVEMFDLAVSRPTKFTGELQRVRVERSGTGCDDLLCFLFNILPN